LTAGAFAGSRFRETALPLLVGLVAVIVLPISALLLQNVGPAARLPVYAYLISTQSAALCAFTVVVAVLLGIETRRFLARRRAASAAETSRGWMRSTQLALVILAAWVLWPQLEARDAWARSHVPQYPELASLPAKLPAVLGDVGPIRFVAPTGSDSHGCGQSMNGFDMHFALDVIGERGRGVLRIDCALDNGVIMEWQSANWQFAGRTTPLPAPR
jgi:hypothetical protein